MKKWQRATGNELDTFLLRNNKVKAQPEREIRDETGVLIPADTIKRSNELTGAGIEYLTSYVEYMCTHFKNLIETEGSRLYYETTLVEWSAFLDIITGGISGQRERAEIAVMHLHAKPKPVIMIAGDGNLRSMQPFVITFDWGRPEELDAKAAARLVRLNKKDDKRERLPIKTISVMFAKPLFEDFFRKGAGTYSFPTGIYAKLFKAAQEMNRQEIEHDLDAHISAYARFARYVIRHNNLTQKQTKDKTYYGQITIETLSFLNDVYPHGLEINGRGEKHIHKNRFKDFITIAASLYRAVEGFIVYPVIERIDADTFRLGIYTNRTRAQEADRKMSPHIQGNTEECHRGP